MLSTWQPYNRIGRPLEAHNARTPEAYLALQAMLIDRNIAAYPGRNWRRPFACGRSAQPFVNAGRWVVLCPECANAPSYDPEWKLACCIECGAIFAGLGPPKAWAEAEVVLMQRPAMLNRHWDPETETVGMLLLENASHGIGGA